MPRAADDPSDLKPVILHVEDRGDGVPIILLHPALESSALFGPFMDALAAQGGLRTIALDLTGHGASPRFGDAASNPWDRLSVESWTADVLATLDSLGIDTFVIVGASLGGTLAQRIAVEVPHRVRAVVTVASPPTVSVAFQEHWRRALEKEEPVPERWATHWAELHGAPYWRELRARALSYFSTMPDDAFPQESLSLYGNPFLTIDPGEDPLYSPVQTMLWRAFVRQAELERPEAGHDFWHDGGDGAAWFHGRVLRFLADHGVLQGADDAGAGTREAVGP